MWIFGHNRNNYGIRYLYDSSTNGTADKIEFHGGHATNTTAWIQLDTGAASFSGNFNIGGTLSVTSNTTIGGTLGVTGATTLNSTLSVSGATTLSGHLYLTGVTSSSTSNTTQIIFKNGNSEAIAISALTGAFIINPSSSNYTGQCIFRPGGNSGLASGTFTINAEPQGSYNLYVNGTTYTNNNITTTGKVYINNTTDIVMADDSGALVIGNKAGTNIGIDGDEIHARNNKAASTLSLNYEGGNIILGVNNTSYYVNVRSTKASTASTDGALVVGGGVGIGGKLYTGNDITASGTIHANGGYLKSTLNSNTVTIGSQNTSFCHIYNSASIPFIFNNTVETTSGNLGTTAYPWNNLYIGKSDGAGIYYTGTKATYKMISFIDNATDSYGNGIAIGGGGQTIIGGGESASTASAQVGTAGSEIMYVCNDQDVYIYTNLQDAWANRKTFGFSTGGHFYVDDGNLYAGTTTSTTEHSVRAISGSGQIYLYSSGNNSNNGNRGIYITAHGNGSAKNIITVDTNNNIFYAGGTITGDLLYKLSSVDASKTNNNISSTLYPTTFCVVDSANRILCRLEGVIQSSGAIRSYWYVRNYNTSGTQTAQKGIYMEVNNEGNMTYSVSDSAAFRSAIGAGTSSLTIGTTGSTAMAGNTTVTNVSQNASTSAQWRKILLGSTEYAAYNTAITATTGVAYEAAAVSVQPSTGTIKANTFSGNLSGNATSSTYLSIRSRLNADANAMNWNPCAEGVFKISAHIMDSTSRNKSAANSPSFDCTVLELPWDWGGYNGQLALTSTSASTPRMQIRSATHIDQGEGVTPRYVPSYSAWREVVTATKATQMGSATKPVYVSNTGQITECTALGGAAYKAADYYATSNHTHSYLPLSGGTMTGDLKGSKTNIIGSTAIANHWYKLYLGGQTVGSNAIDSATPLIEFSNVDRSQYCQLIYSDFDSLVSPDSLTLIGNQAGTHFIAPKINAGGYINNSYAMSTASFICESWVRTKGATGWYNEDYGGGWYMPDANYVKLYGNKQVVISSSHATSTTNKSSQLIVSSVAYNSNLDTADAGAVAIELWRGGNASWQIINDGGNLHFKNNWTTAKQSTYTQDSVSIAYNSGTLTTITGNLFSGTTTATSEHSVRAISNSGQIYLYSSGNANSNGNRGLYLSAHGSGSAKNAIIVDTNNNVTFYGALSGNASTATSLQCGVTLNDVSGSSYGNVKVTTAKGGYYGFLLGTSTSCINIMSTGVHNGIYCQAKSRWVFYYNSTDDRCSIGGSTTTANYILTVAGSMKVNNDITANKVYNAVWNDYAECRQVETEEPGYCVTETSSGTMIKTNKRLQAGCKITSDTFGTCMGETDTAKTPIAVAGRVLVYPYRARKEYELGAAVCSAPNGTVDIMTRDEIMMYPERIVGTVSEIPIYEIWHGGDNDNDIDIKVNGRIWIYVR